ncbi:predicted protein [Plenodomus lingam JN3]|uniref:Predicted protein n=1 Tax=Leptosphaeria maculans (strain JN3 / isolate v23.1.3 / race Av1-4-5-6-7-8) TaxID=985895 RepID=E4ZIT5_LEPMJ|nr:predicted protein [Plenodomus lingam JN3]CBX91106.1 predicted protein [Plenodomus lingam JN3]
MGPNGVQIGDQATLKAEMLEIVQNSKFRGRKGGESHRTSYQL